MNQELLNCLSEALPYAALERGPVTPTGSGPITITVKHPVYCKSTDAFAGMMTYAIHHVESKEEADSWIEANYNQDEERECQIDISGLPEPEPKPIFAGQDDEDYVPF